MRVNPMLIKSKDMNLPSSESTQFDYLSLDSEVRIVVQKRTFEIKRLMKRTVQDIIEIGQKLTEVKYKLGHGNFLKWLEMEFEWKERSARNFMQVAKAFESAKFADIDLSPSALYLLSAPSIPEQVRQKVLDLAKHGEIITYTRAKNIIDEHKKDKQNIPVKITNSELIENNDFEAKVINQSVQSTYLPIVKVLSYIKDRIEAEINYLDINLNIRADKDDFISFFLQIKSNPNYIKHIIKQVESKTEEKV